MGLVDGLHPDLVDAVQDVEEVLLRVDRDLVDRADDLADHSLPGRGAGHVAQLPEMGEQRAVDEAEIGAHRRVGQLRPFRPAGGRPVAPAEGRRQRWREPDPERRGLLRLDLLALVENPQEQDPRELRHVLESARVVRAPHDIRDLLDRGVDGRGSGEAAWTVHEIPSMAVWATSRSSETSRRALSRSALAGSGAVSYMKSLRRRRMRWSRVNAG